MDATKLAVVPGSEGDPARCGHVKDDGDRCGVRIALNPRNGLCVWHDPERRGRASEMRAKGGRNTGRARRQSPARPVRVVDVTETPGPPPETLEDALLWASWAVHAVATGKMDAKTGHEVGFLLRAFLDGRRHLDKVDERIRKLQETLRKLQRDGEGDR